jgi:hypothetical protein
MKENYSTTKKSFGNDKPENREQPIELGFIAVTVFALLGPTLLLCLVLGQVWPFFLIAGSDALGASLGVAKFRRPGQGIPACVPVTHVSSVSRQTDLTELKKAA